VPKNRLEAALSAQTFSLSLKNCARRSLVTMVGRL